MAENAFRMKLDTFNRVIPVADTHDVPVIETSCRDFKRPG
jgi:hypothetical protein